MADRTPQIVVDSEKTDNRNEEKQHHSKEKKHKGTGAKIKSFFNKIKENAKKFAEEGIIYESRPRRLSDGSEEVTLIVAPWGKQKRRFSVGDDIDSHPPPKDVIAPTAATLRRIALWKKKGAFEAIDKYAFETPEAYAKNVTLLTNYLMAGVPTNSNSTQITTISNSNNNSNVNDANSESSSDISITPFLKVRAIFSWIARHISYDVDLFESGGTTDASPQKVLNTRKAVCEGYANLFRAMALEAGFTCWKIGGQVTGSSFISGMDSSDSDTAHAWNALQIHGQYYLVDATWGAGYVKNHKFIQSFCPYFFLTPPEELIYTHFPDWPQWQLLETPISKQQFAELPYLLSYFFERGLKMRSRRKGKLGVVEVGDTIILTLSAPKNVLFVADLFEISHRNENQIESPKKNEYKQFVFIQLSTDSREREHLDEDEEVFEFRIRPPHYGKFRVEIYTKLRENPKNSYDLTIEYFLECAERPSSPRPNDNVNTKTSVSSNSNAFRLTVNEPKGTSQSSDSGFVSSVPPPRGPNTETNAVISTTRSHSLQYTQEMSLSPTPRRRDGRAIPFPKQYGNFQEMGHTLIWPLDGDLERNINYRFVVAKGKAIKMDLVVNGSKKQFLPMKLIQNHFEIEYVVREGPIQICAQYDPKRTDWAVLLEYTVSD
jgi:hypothetical protein